MIKERDLIEFSQVCVWPCTIVGEDEIEGFEKFFLDELDVKIKYLEEVETKPDRGQTGCSIEKTGGRNDAIFAVHKDCIDKFALPRLKLGIRWIEDAMSPVNGYNENPIYPDYFKDYMTWNPDGEAIRTFKEEMHKRKG